MSASLKRKQSVCVTALICVVALSACTDGDYYEILDEYGNGADSRTLSAGKSTVFQSGVSAYDTPADWVTGNLSTRFYQGDALYDNPRVSGDDPAQGGKGPLYAGSSCGSCHSNAGRTYPTLYSEGGTGSGGFSSHLIYITKKNGGFFRNYGRVLHDQAITGVEPEGKLGVTYSEKTYTFHDGEEYSLLTPTYTISEWYADSIAAEDLIVDVRIPLRHVGMGQMMALDPTELEELARRSNYPEYGISGRLNYITERGKQYIGISGNKAQHADLTIELGFSSDLGVTNDRYPLEVAEGQSQMLGYSHYGIQISTHDMENVDFYLHTLGVPARRNVDDPIVQQGEQAFYRARCDLCHVPTLHTRADAPALIGGTRLPWLASETIHPYSDFLLHDMGPDLDSHYVSGLAQGCEWRTTPLWGIGLQQKVNQHTYFLHDGRARNLKEAIMWHGGEGAVSRELFARMSREDRDALIKFLESL